MEEISALPFVPLMDVPPGIVMDALANVILDGNGITSVRLVALNLPRKDKLWGIHKMQVEVPMLLHLILILIVTFQTKGVK